MSGGVDHNNLEDRSFDPYSVPSNPVDQHSSLLEQHQHHANPLASTAEQQYAAATERTYPTQPFQPFDHYFRPPSSSHPSTILPTPPLTSNSSALDQFSGATTTFPSPSRSARDLSPLQTTMFGAPIPSPSFSNPFGGGNEGSASATATTPAPGGSGTNGTKVVQKADRSCKKCRERRVRCDRAYPACARCKKRRDECSYGTGVFVETVEEGSDQAKITDLEAKVANLENQLKNAGSASPKPHSPRSFSLPPPAAPLATLANETLAGVISHAVTSCLSTPDELGVVDGLLKEQDQAASLGTQDRRAFATGRRDIAITCFLLDASIKACCTKLPGLHLLRDRLPYFKANITSLEPCHRLAVVCLCSIGVRVAPNSSLFGIRSVTQSDGSPSTQAYLAVGSRRERVCQALAAVAIEACWATGILKHRSYDNLDALVGLVQYLIHEEGKVEESRLFVREMVGMFLDLRHEELSTGAPSRVNETNTTAVFLADAFVSSVCHKPSFITPGDLQDYFATSGLRVPDLVNMQLGQLIEDQLGSPLNRTSILSMLTQLCLYVFSCHRVFSQVSNPRRPNGSSILPFLRNLWAVLDQIHNAVQRLQQHLVNLSSAPPGYADDPHAIDHAILLAVRADNSLVDLIMLIHVHLTSKYSDSVFWPEKDGNEDLERMRSESAMRVFKCLKLLAFYCQLYLASQDKHNVFHLLLRLETLPEWTTLVALRIGSSGGPVSEEFEATHEELDWFRSGLELACYYSPRAASQLAALQNARQRYGPTAYQPLSPSSLQPHSMPHSPTHDTSISSCNDSADMSATVQQPQQPYQSYDTPSTSASFYPSSSTFIPTPASQVVVLSGSGPSSPRLRQDSSHSIHASLPPPPTLVPQLSQPQHLTSANTPAVSTDIAIDSDSPMASFASGLVDDIGGENADIRSAFRSLDWVDLSFTPAMGANGGSDGSSAEGGESWKRAKTTTEASRTS